eukprot:scaffold170316_cov46-Cyclotella_meneghiniana.AAC.2
MRLITLTVLSLAACVAGETVTTTTSNACQANDATCTNAASTNASDDTPGSEEGNDATETNNPQQHNNDAGVWDFPEGWKEYTYIEIRDHFNCPERSRDNNKPLPTLQEWQLMRDTYTRIVDNSKTWDDVVPPTLGYSLKPGIP